MKRNLLIIVLAAGLVACSTETDSSTDATPGTENNSSEAERLGTERSDFYEKQVKALGEGDMEAADKYKAQMDSVDALYMKAIGR